MSDAYAIKEKGGTYFLTCTIIGWVDLFTRERYQKIITDSLTYCRRHKQLQLHAWVLMSNHLHWVASVPHDVMLSDVIRDFKKHTSRQIIDSLTNESGESRREWMLNIFGYAGRNNRDNTHYQIWRNDNPCNHHLQRIRVPGKAELHPSESRSCRLGATCRRLRLQQR